MHLVARLDTHLKLSDQEVSKRAGEQGIVLPALSGFYRGAHPQQGVLMGYAGLSEAEIQAGVSKLIEILDA